MSGRDPYSMIESGIMVAALRRRIGQYMNERDTGGEAKAEALADDIAENCLDDIDLMRLIGKRWEAAQARRMDTVNHMTAATFIEEFESATGLAILRA